MYCPPPCRKRTQLRQSLKLAVMMLFAFEGLVDESAPAIGAALPEVGLTFHARRYLLL